MTSKETLLQKYEEYKKEFDRIPKYREFLRFAGIHGRVLVKIYGEDAYSKLQMECGDLANKLNLEKTPLEKIMRQYGDLALEAGKLPSSSVWIHQGLKPTISGLERSPHFIKWPEFPKKFARWAEVENAVEYKEVLELIEASSSSSGKSITEKSDREFEELINAVRSWIPDRRRNVEETYKVELRKHLEAKGFKLHEEFGESNFDLLIRNKYAIEIKKAPNQSEYDRMFGQLARHLQHQLHVIALVLDAPTQDKFDNFTALVDLYLNKNEKFVEVIKK